MCEGSANNTLVSMQPTPAGAGSELSQPALLWLTTVLAAWPLALAWPLPPTLPSPVPVPFHSALLPSCSPVDCPSPLAALASPSLL